MPLWEELATLVTIMLVGHWIEMRSISQAQGALRELARRPADHRAVPRELPEDDPESVVGGGLQHRHDPARRRTKLS